MKYNTPNEDFRNALAMDKITETGGEYKVHRHFVGKWIF
jgi:hypothetical protein